MRDGATTHPIIFALALAPPKTDRAQDPVRAPDMSVSTDNGEAMEDESSAELESPDDEYLPDGGRGRSGRQLPRCHGPRSFSGGASAQIRGGNSGRLWSTWAELQPVGASFGSHLADFDQE